MLLKTVRHPTGENYEQRMNEVSKRPYGAPSQSRWGTQAARCSTWPSSCKESAARANAVVGLKHSTFPREERYADPRGYPKNAVSSPDARGKGGGHASIIGQALRHTNNIAATSG